MIDKIDVIAYRSISCDRTPYVVVPRMQFVERLTADCLTPRVIFVNRMDSARVVRLQSSPTRNIGSHQSLEESSMRWIPQVQQLMDNHVVLKPFALIGKVKRQRYGARRRT